MIIGISGKAQAGKTTGAKYLQSNFDSVQIFSFATALKEIAIDLFDLDRNKVYGDNNAKNESTHLCWEHMPGVITSEYVWNRMPKGAKVKSYFHLPGQLSHRDVLEFFGTFIVRKIYEDAWVNKTLSDIIKSKSSIAIIDDVRSVNEICKIKEMGGKVIRLTRNPLDRNTSIERALDQANFAWDNFDHIINNDFISECHKNEELHSIMNALMKDK